MGSRPDTDIDQAFVISCVQLWPPKFELQN